MRKIALAAAAALAAATFATAAMAQAGNGFNLHDCINEQDCDASLAKITMMSGPNKGQPMTMPIVIPKGYVNQAPATAPTEDDLSCVTEGTCAFITVVPAQPK